MDLRSLAFLGPIEARPAAALGSRLDRSGIHDHRRRLRGAPFQQPDYRPQIVTDGLEYPRLAPPPRLLIDGGPRWEVVGQKPPLTAGLDHVTQGVEQLPQRMIALRRILAHQAQIRQQKLPFRIRNIAGIRLPCRAHAPTSTTFSR